MARERLIQAAYVARQELIRWPLLMTHVALGKYLGREDAPPDASVIRHIQARYWRLLKTDFDNVRRGIYPTSLLFSPGLRQRARAVPEFLRQMPSIVERARSGNFQDLPADADRNAFPAYYLRNFHWQTDGYLSARSAEVYDLQVDWLFLGSTDAMRRQVLPPIVEFGAEAGPLKVLDVACGTGRTLEQLSVTLPAAELHGVDLSPPYVAYAQASLGDRAWLRVANGENLPYDDGSFDVVTSTYLFHELPKDARRAVMTEMVRVLRPGGLAVIEDSAQLCDSPDIAPSLVGFARMFHEPYFKGYLQDDLAVALGECGLTDAVTATHFVAKVVTARKR